MLDKIQYLEEQELKREKEKQAARRDYFAAMAMQTLIPMVPTGNDTLLKQRIKEATQVADALIAELDKPKESL